MQHPLEIDGPLKTYCFRIHITIESWVKTHKPFWMPWTMILCQPAQLYLLQSNSFGELIQMTQWSFCKTTATCCKNNLWLKRNCNIKACVFIKFSFLMWTGTIIWFFQGMCITAVCDIWILVYTRYIHAGAWHSYWYSMLHGLFMGRVRQGWGISSSAQRAISACHDPKPP